MIVAPAVLLVEDNVLVLDLLTEVVGDLGYRAVETTDGTEAMAAMESGEFDLLVTDQRLPGAYSGGDLATHFRRLFPVAGILLTSGAPMLDDLSPTGISFLQKPFTVAMLKEALAREFADT